MNNQTYRFNIGSFQCIAVSDGTHTYAPPVFPPPATFLFSNAPQEILRKVLEKHNIKLEDWTEWISPYICLVVETGEHRVLVDTGGGDVGPDTGKLLQNLKNEGIEPEDIDTIIITHGHPDHIGGNTDSEGRLTFPDARYFMWKDEWDFWKSEEPARKIDEHSRDVLIGYARRNLPPIKSKLTLIDTEAEILPGIQAIANRGHTPGHMILRISSGHEQLLCISDAFLHPVHVGQPEWCAAVDLEPGQVVDSRRSLLKQAAEGQTLVLAFHFPFPGLGYIISEGDAYQWNPALSAE